MKTRDIQERLAALGYNPGPIDGIPGPETRAAVKAFQAANPPLVVDGVVGSQTAAVLRLVSGEPGSVSPGPGRVVQANWLPPARVDRIVLHWSAGSYQVSAVDKEHYHFIVDGDGVPWEGEHTVDDNEYTGDGDYAAHTRGLNTRSVGLSVACMAGAQEAPFDPGPYPLKEVQWRAAAAVAADVLRAYALPVSLHTMLSHAEIEDVYGVDQHGKWDVARLPFASDVRGARECGDIFRNLVADLV